MAAACSYYYGFVFSSLARRHSETEFEGKVRRWRPDHQTCNICGATAKFAAGATPILCKGICRRPRGENLPVAYGSVLRLSAVVQ